MASVRYIPTIGLEVHAELNTLTKMFCDSKNDASEKRPNSNVCPVCMAHPGTLPVINKAAVEHVLRVGAALGADLADYTEFDRKNYFYPDLPKGYQLSQYEYPLVSGGVLNGVKLTRIHLEEDTASSIHDENSDTTLVDYNRAGVPLMELVTEPVIHSAEEAGNFGRELQLLLRYLGASEADMEKGQMRLEANISVAPVEDGATQNVPTTLDAAQALTLHEAKHDHGVVDSTDTRAGAPSTDMLHKNAFSVKTLGKTDEVATHLERTAPVNATGVDLTKLGTKVEVKNINSFRAMERAIQFEVKRQIALLEKGEKVVQETRGWDENKQATFSQRVKEGSADYRYFPDPDLPSLKLSELGLHKVSIEKTLPELPWQKRERLKRSGINTQDIELYVKDSVFGAFFDKIEKLIKANSDELKLASNYIANDLVNLVQDIRDSAERDTKNEDIIPISSNNFVNLIKLIAQKKISSRSAKDILLTCMDGFSIPEQIARDRNLLQESAGAEIAPAVAKILATNGAVVNDYKGGKEAALQFLIGQGMKTLRGAANPEALKQEILKQISEMA